MKILSSFTGILYMALISGLVSCRSTSKEQTQLLYTEIKTITYVIDKDTFKNQWTVSPELNPDVLEVEVDQHPRNVVFISDSGTVSFMVNLHDTIRFAVLLNKDTAWTAIVGAPKNVNFSDSYIQSHKGKHEVDIPEVHELANILVALSKVGHIDSNMVNMTTPYYKEVMNHFLPYASHPLLDTINHKIVSSKDEMSYWHYYALKMNACAYEFNEHGVIVNKGIIRRMGFGNAPNPMDDWSEMLRDFSKKSKFRAFYKAHQTYYDSLRSIYKSLNPIDKMQQWLEHKFGFGYGNYTVYFSPLVGGAHSTQQFEDNGFKQTVMFVCMADINPKYNMNMNEMLESRVVFTEIDHNFVNPVSMKFSDAINKVFAKRSKWVEVSPFTDAYGSPEAVFNEYMTWALFSIYCIENFPDKDVKQMLDKMEQQMEKSRGFIKFASFNQELIKVYRLNSNKSMEQLFSMLLQWSEKQ